MEYLVGSVLGILVGVFSSLVGLDRDRALYPAILIVVASYYDLFAVMGGSTGALLAEIAAGLIFVGLAVAGFRSNLWLTVAGLIGHGVFDIFHDYAIYNPGVPDYWMGFCSSIDVAMGAYLALMLWFGRIRAGSLHSLESGA